MRVNGLDMLVELDGAGPPLLLLHGFTGSLEAWSEIRVALRARARLVLVDLIGHGASESPADPLRYSMQHCVQDLIALLDELAITQADVLGYSMGGRVALHLALRAPHRIRRLVLESASPGIEDESERSNRIRADDQLADRIERDGIEVFVDAWEQQPLLTLAEHVPSTTRQRQHQLRLQNRTLGLANSLRGMGTGQQLPVWDRLPHFERPTLLVVGERDARYRGIAERMQRLLPNATLEVIDNAGHTAHVDQPAQFAPLVTNFLDRP
jgi:2-succinyl-6-hydroxy-2,4-cyclohexadiene-1-carboxylate synthase